MDKGHSRRLLWSVEYVAIVLMGTVLLGLMGCKQESDPLSNEKEITGFSIGVRETGTPVSGTIQPATREITVSIPVTTNLDTTWLIPTIKVSAYAKVSPASGEAQDFSKSVVYTVTAEDGTTQEYLVGVTITGKSTAKVITAFGIPGQLGASVLNEAEKTIEVTMPIGTDLSALVPAITAPNASVVPNSGVAQDFSKGPVIYTVTPQEGSTQDYTVVVKEEDKANAKVLSVFTILNQVGTSVLNETNKTIEVTMPVGTDMRALIPTITISPLATVAPASRVEQDFSKPVVYTVTAQNGTTADYIVTVKEFGRNDAKAITGFNINVTGATTAAIVAGTPIVVTVPVGTDVRALIPTITISNDATVAPASRVAQDFSKPVVYTVTAEDGSTQDYTVVVNEATRSSLKAIATFAIPGQVGTSVSNETNKTIEVTMPVGTGLSALIPVITLTGSGTPPVVTSTVAPASGVAQDFSKPVVYKVTAQDGSTQDYTVTVKEAPSSGDNAITKFAINGKENIPVGDARIITFSTTGSAGLGVGTNVKSLIPVIEVSPFATVSPASLTAKDFTNPVVYTVRAQDGSTRDYTVVVQRSSDKDITGLGITGGTVVQNGTIITVTMPAGTDPARLAPTFTTPDGATASPASGTPGNFSPGPKTYTVTAEDETTKDFVVAVLVEDPITAVKIDLAGTGKGIEIYSTPGFGVGHNIALSLNGRAKNKEAVVSLKVTESTNWSVTGWKVDGRALPMEDTSEIYGNNSNIITLKASNYFIGRHSVTFTVLVNGQPYSEQFYFTVDK